MTKYQDIFTPGKIPDETYNDRAETKLVPEFNGALNSGGKIVLLTGQTKIGKTVLVRKVISDDKRIEIQASDLTDSSGNDPKLENVIATKLGTFPIEKETIKKIESENQISASATAKVGAKIKFWKSFISSAEASASANASRTGSSVINEIFKDDLFTKVSDYLIENEYVLVFDDFHYLSPEKQKEVVRRLKDPLSKGAKIVIVLIPNRNEDIISAEPDMMARTREIKVPSWKPDELRYVPNAGFKKLNVKLDDSVVDSIVENSFMNPYLVQDICSRICEDFNINETTDEVRQISIDEEQLNQVYNELTTSNSLIDLIEKGKTTKGPKRRKFHLINSQSSVDTYGLIIRALGMLADQNEIKISRLVDQINSIIREHDSGPRRSDITQTLGRMVDIAKESDERDPVLVYENDMVKMYDPFFSFDIKWKYMRE
ncbi:hypothetical protein [Lactiplantibacillus plantarum]|uniref:hypothetical protein n=1 Tax=Lactiplantibacillus plantarum TaxID=1590 RepID=UPI0032E50EB5